MKNCLILFIGIVYCGSIIGCEGPRTRSMARQWRANRDAILARQPYSLEQFAEEEKERLYQLNKSILAQSFQATKENAEQLLHGSSTSWILGALCLGTSFYQENSNGLTIKTIAQCAGCACITLGAIAAFRACKEYQCAQEEAYELAEMQNKEI